MPRWTNEERLLYKNRLLTELYKHPGPGRKIGMGELYEVVFQKPWNNRINDTRTLRKLVEELQEDGVAIDSSSSKTDGGYWLMTSSSEINDKCQKLEIQIRKKAEKISALRQKTLPEVMGQLTLNFRVE